MISFCYLLGFSLKINIFLIGDLLFKGFSVYDYFIFLQLNGLRILLNFDCYILYVPELLKILSC